MKHETRTVAYDGMLEAYHFKGIARPFPNHFHAYYVIGLVERGTRTLLCKNREYDVKPGTILLFNPGDSHACTQSGSHALDYRAINITKETMLDLAGEVTGERELPGFSSNVILDREAASCLRPLHELIMRSSQEFRKEELLLMLISLLIQHYGQPFSRCIPECREELEQVCRFMEQHYDQPLCLDQLCRYASLSKSTLLRAFVRAKGVTPYSYLQNIRIGQAKKLLEQGVTPVEAALQTGFSDQSHFTNYFTRFLGLSPGAYRDIFKAAQSGTSGLPASKNKNLYSQPQDAACAGLFPPCRVKKS